jgi:hypothetical protein
MRSSKIAFLKTVSVIDQSLVQYEMSKNALSAFEAAAGFGFSMARFYSFGLND